MEQVFVVDEESIFAANVLSILRIEGYKAKRFADATEAFEFFHANKGDPTLTGCKLLIDVALAPGADRTRFGPEATEGFLKTGIVLVEALMPDFPDLVTPKRTVLYTAHYTQPVWRDIVLFCELNGFRSWQKRPDADAQDILALVQEP